MQTVAYCYSELCLTQLVKHVPLIHAFAPGMHTCVVTPHGEWFSMWRISTLTKVITEQCFYLNDLLRSSGVAIYTGFHISVFLGAVRIWPCVFQLWNTTRGRFQIAVCLQVCVWVYMCVCMWFEFPMRVMLRNEAWSECGVRVCKSQQVEWLGNLPKQIKWHQNKYHRLIKRTFLP